MSESLPGTAAHTVRCIARSRMEIGVLRHAIEDARMSAEKSLVLISETRTALATLDRCEGRSFSQV